MTSGIVKEDYNDKCFVLRGETQPAKQDIKTMGGKFNGRLTDGRTGERFAGWIFPNSMSDQVQTWIDTGAIPSHNKTNQYSIKHTGNVQNTANVIRPDTLNDMSKKLDDIENMLKCLLRFHGCKMNNEMSKSADETCEEGTSGEHEITHVTRLLPTRR